MRAFRTLVFATGVCCLGLPQLVARIAAADPAQPPTPKKETASQSTSPPRSANAPSWDLHGVVVNESGIPIAHAKVTARVYPLDHSVETGADGSFAMTIARKPTLFALIHAKDQASGLQGFVRLQDPKVLEQQTPIRVILKKPHEIAITVTDQSDKPVEHAKVAANSMFGNFEQRETDSAGKAVFHIPAGLPLRSEFAVKPDVGLDYIDYSQARHGGDTQNQSLEKDSQLKFVLGGARTVNVRVTDRQGKPVVGAQVNPSYFTLPKKAALHLFDEDLLAQVTDSHGNASFRFIPSANFGPILFNVRLADHVVVERPTFDPKSKSGDITAVLVPVVQIRGQIN